MDTSDIQDLVADLSENLDDLETALSPLLTTALATTTSKLPLLDKAKLHVLATYAIESVLFSYLKLNAVDVAQHDVAKELTRVKGYFEKVREAETGPAQRTHTVDREAAVRFVRHGLSGNERLDRERGERERAGAKRKAEEVEASAQWGSGNRFAGVAKRLRAEEPSVTVARADDEEDDEEEGEGEGAAREPTKEEKKAAKHQRRMERKQAKQSPVDEAAFAEAADGLAQPKQKSKKPPKDAHEAFQALVGDGQEDGEGSAKKSKKKRKKRSEMQRELEDKRAREMM